MPDMCKKSNYFFKKRLPNKLISFLLIKNYFDRSFISVVIIVDFKRWRKLNLKQNNIRFANYYIYACLMVCFYVIFL